MKNRIETSTKTILYKQQQTQKLLPKTIQCYWYIQIEGRKIMLFKQKEKKNPLSIPVSYPQIHKNTLKHIVLE